MLSYSAAAHLLPLTSSSVSPHRSSSTKIVAPRLHCPNSVIQCTLPSQSAFSSSQNAKPAKCTPSLFNSLISPKSVAVSAASCILFHIANPIFSGSDSIFNFEGGGGSGGSGGCGSGGSGGGQGGDFWNIFSPTAIAKDDEPQQDWDSHGLPANILVQPNELCGFKKYKVSEIVFFDRRSGASVGTGNSFFEMAALRPGGIYTKRQLQQVLKALSTCGMFEKVEMEIKTNPDGTVSITIPFLELTWETADRFRCINVGLMPQWKPINMDPDMIEKERIDYYRSQEKDYRKRMERARPCLLPVHVHWEILDMISKSGALCARLLQKIRDGAQQWYHGNGNACAQVVNLVEGDITQFQDKLGNVCEGNIQYPEVRREFPKKLRQGQVINIEAVNQALRNINPLVLFSNTEVNPRSDEKNEGGINVEIKLKEQEQEQEHEQEQEQEKEQESAKVSTEWSIIPVRCGCPTLASIQPGVTVSFEYRNINGLNRSLLGSVTTNNFLSPQDDLGFKLEYVHPYVDGVYNPCNRTLRAGWFNSRKLSPVFTGGPGIEEVPPILVDRAGVKANITESFTPQSKFTYGLVMEEITTLEESSHISANGQRVLPSGEMSADGPPTTLSGTGVDRMTFLQANITRDNTKFVNGAIVGDRNVFQIDQGLGIGSRFPFFNRHQLTVTRFLQLKSVEEGAGKQPPPVLVLHGRYGGCVGDLPSYDAFTLGGPYSVRGYSMGELGAARNIVELAAELRIPVRNMQAYVFAEHGNDLGSSKDVNGNPTEAYSRMGRGSSYGVGAKIGSVHVEYAVGHNSGTGAIFFRFGERF